MWTGERGLGGGGAGRGCSRSEQGKVVQLGQG